MGATSTWTKVHDEDDHIRAGKANLIKKVYTFKCSASYATGGDTVTPATDYAKGANDTVVAANVTQETGGHTYVAKYDVTNNKVLLYDVNTGAQISATTDVSAPTFRAELAIARG